MAEEVKTFAIYSNLEKLPAMPGYFAIAVKDRSVLRLEKDNTVYFQETFRQPDGFLKDPGGLLWEILDLKGTKVGSGAMYKKEDGVWYFFWTPSSTGDFLLKVTGRMNAHFIDLRRKIKVLESKA